MTAVPLRLSGRGFFFPRPDWEPLKELHGRTTWKVLYYVQIGKMHGGRDGRSSSYQSLELPSTFGLRCCNWHCVRPHDWTLHDSRPVRPPSKDRVVLSKEHQESKAASSALSLEIPRSGVISNESFALIAGA